MMMMMMMCFTGSKYSDIKKTDAVFYYLIFKSVF